MRALRTIFLAGVAVVFSVQLNAQAARPKNATARCNDGSWSSAKSEQGACSSHGGVKSWLADEKPVAPKAPPKATKAEPSPRASDRADRAPSATRASATGQCGDGTFTTAATKTGACSGHGGVVTWFSDASPRTVNPPAATPATPSPRATTPPSARRPAGTPADATAMCNDGSLSYAKQHQGACSQHGGVKTWFR